MVREQYSAMIRESVEKFKQNLSEKEKAIIDLRLMTDEPITLQEIADKHGLSRERIRQLETRLKEQLKVFLAKELDVSEDEIAEGGEY